MKEKGSAWLNWSREAQAWVLRVWKDNEWQVSQTWEVKDQDETSDEGWVHDSVLCELAGLQSLGYSVRITIS